MQFAVELILQIGDQKTGIVSCNPFVSLESQSAMNLQILDTIRIGTEVNEKILTFA
jgi:hypothetical protein